MLPFDSSRLVAALNEDGEFRIGARLWTGAVRLDAGEDRYVLRMAGGEASAFEPSDGSGAVDLAIGASPEQWELLLEAEPQPFYHDLYAARTWQGITLEGDQLRWAPRYPAVRRLLEVMRGLAVARAGG